MREIILKMGIRRLRVIAAVFMILFSLLNIYFCLFTDKRLESASLYFLFSIIYCKFDFAMVKLQASEGTGDKS